jgi:lipoprotein signal peptidase
MFDRFVTNRQVPPGLAVALAVALADQGAKAVVPHLDASAVVPMRNPGFLTGWAPIPAPAVAIVSVVMLGVFVALVGRWSSHIGLSPCIPAVIAGGMGAHALDRVVFGAVRDFIATPWLVIDVADVAIFVGMIALVLALVHRVRHLRRESCAVVLQLRTMRATIVNRQAA